MERLLKFRDSLDSGASDPPLSFPDYPESEELHAKNSLGQTSLHVAVLRGDASKFEALLSRGASASKPDAFGMTALHYCACRSHREVEMIKKLVEAGAALNERDLNFRTPFSLFCINPSLSVLQYLSSRSPSLSAKDADHWTPLHYACSTEFPLDGLEMLTQNGAALNVDKRGRTPLHLACIRGILPIAKYLIESAGAQVDTKDAEGWTPLAIAVANEHEILARWLVASGGASVERAVTARGWTILHIAASIGKLSMVKLALKVFNVPVNATDHNGRTALHYAIARDMEDLEKELVEAGADMDIQDARGVSPLQLKNSSSSWLSSCTIL